MGTVKLNFPPHQLKPLHFTKRPKTPQSPPPTTITCSLRNGPRKPLWRARRLSTEAIQAIQSLKLAKSSPSRLQHVFHSKLSRLLKADLLDTLDFLQTQNELDLAPKVFELMQGEVWYRPDLTLYHGMIRMFGKNKMINIAEEYFRKIEEEGLKPDTRAFTELIGAYLQVEMIDKAVETYERMKASGCDPDKLTFTIMIRNLKEAGKEELADTIRKECADYMDYPNKFLKQVDQKRTAKPSVDLI